MACQAAVAKFWRIFWARNQPQTSAEPRFVPQFCPNPHSQSVSREAISSRKSSRVTSYYPQMKQPPRALRSTRGFQRAPAGLAVHARFSSRPRGPCGPRAVFIAPPRFESAPRGLGPCKAPIRNGPFLCHGVPFPNNRKTKSLASHGKEGVLFPNNRKTTTGWPREILTGLKGCPVAPICEKVQKPKTDY